MREPNVISTPSLFARLSAGAIGTLIVAAFALESTLGEGTVAQNAVGMLRFFTIWGNLATAAVMLWIATGRQAPAGILAALATALTVIGTVYWILLAGEHHPEGLGRLTNQVFHTIAPIAFIGWWFAFAPSAPDIRALVPAIMVPPLTYGLFAFILGEATGFYAYFFLDLPNIGWAQFLINNVVLAAFFAALGAALLWIKRTLARHG